MYVMIDNYDSFVYNLVSYFEELGIDIKIVRNDSIELEDLETMIKDKKLEGIIISPGPKTPKDAGISGEIIQSFKGRIPILGVCLGHQIIAYEFGGCVEKGKCPIHGKVNAVFHNRRGVFRNIPTPYNVTRYHSLRVNEEKLPECLSVDAKSEDDVVMAISHKEYPIYGVQFHPEAVLTEYGHKLLENFIGICNEWRKDYEFNS